MNSAQRVAAVSRRFRLEGDVPSAPVLLVDDQVVTGWTLTVAAHVPSARPARDAPSCPLALAVRGLGRTSGQGTTGRLSRRR